MMIFLSVLVVSGCSEQDGYNPNTSRSPGRGSESLGKVFYLDGAGNMGFGQETVGQGLRLAGFNGNVENIIWTSFTGPLGDQVIRLNARLRSENLTKKIRSYQKRCPQAPVYVIGLSAGTGVAVWGIENLPEDIKVDAVVLLGSSLSKSYNMARCLKHVKNKVYVLYSPHDAVLNGFIPITGTIDGAYLVEPAGLVGMTPPNNVKPETIQAYQEKIVNIPWQESFERMGNAGGHTDGTSLSFVRGYVAPKLLGIGPKQIHPAD